MMETIKVQILNDGLHAKEVNLLGDEPKEKDFMHLNPFLMADAFKDKWYPWHFAEQKLRTFAIESELIKMLKIMADKVAEMYGEKGAVIVHNNDSSLIPGSIREAQILPNGKIKIIQ